MTATLYAMPGNEGFTDLLRRHTLYRRQSLVVHHFPDEETLVRLEAPQPGRPAVIVCTLDRPDAKLWPLMMAAATARELGASHVGLVAPYLAYMRQDARFRPGEAVSAQIFGRWLGHTFDWLVTADPHLHRHHDMEEIYPRSSSVVHAAPELAAWIATHVEKPLIVGPDDESAQWAMAVARLLCAPSIVAHKERRGDRDVTICLPELGSWRDYTPVLLDDIIASGETMRQVLRALRAQASRPPVCVAVHGVFAEGSLQGLCDEGVGILATSNSIVGDTAQIDISRLVAAAVIERCTNLHPTDIRQEASA
jgi:ribose-phosphate pyrophosphokinase